MFLIITASSNADGFTAACAKAALDGIESAGGKLVFVFYGEGWDFKQLQYICLEPGAAIN